MRFQSFITFLLMILFVGNAWGTHVSLDTLPPPPPPPPLSDNDDDTVFKIVEYMPCFEGCGDIVDETERKLCSDKAIIAFINKNVTYPHLARTQNVEGIAVIRFIVDKDGSLSFGPEAILRNPGAGCGEEALRVAKKMPRWNPGKSQGKEVRVQFTLPIKFQLTDDSEILAVPVKWGGIEMKGTRKAEDSSNYTTTSTSLKKAIEILSVKRKGISLSMDFGETKGGFAKYFISVGKEGKKYLIDPILNSKGMKKKIIKLLKKGETIYFYNWQFKKTFMEIKITE